MQRWWYQNPSLIKVLGVIKNEYQYIGCSLIMQDNHISCFIIPGYRRLGLGKKLIKMVAKRLNTSSEFYYGLGINGSEIFFTKSLVKRKKEAKHDR